MHDGTRETVAVADGHSVELHGNAHVVKLASTMLEMGRRLHVLHATWTAHDEYPGECVDSGSGADIAEAIFAILTDNGYPVD